MVFISCSYEQVRPSVTFDKSTAHMECTVTTPFEEEATPVRNQVHKRIGMTCTYIYHVYIIYICMY